MNDARGETHDQAVTPVDALVSQDAARGADGDRRAAMNACGDAHGHAATRAEVLTSQDAAGGADGAITAEPTSDRPIAPPTVTPNRHAALGAFATLAALALLCLAWEWRLAPLRAGGSALVLKALPLLIALPGVFRRRVYTLQWASMLVLVYFAEGIVRGMTDAAPGNRLGWVEAALALGFFACALAYVAPFKRAARRKKRDTA